MTVLTRAHHYILSWDTLIQSLHLQFKPPAGKSQQKIHSLPLIKLDDHSGRTIKGMNFLHPFKQCDRGFESHSRLAFFVLCVGRGLGVGLIIRPRDIIDSV
jgi:hypothetical protein